MSKPGKEITSLDDLIGIEYIKLGFFRELQEKITQLERANYELELKQRHIQSILEGITDVMAILSLDYRIISVNQVFYEIFDDPAPEGKFCYQVFRKRQTVCEQCIAFEAIQTNKVQRRIEIIQLDDKIRHFEITASPLRNIEGNPYQLLILKRDVTFEQEFQAKLYQTEKMATIGLLAAGVAHEVNNPLTSILGFTQGLKRKLSKIKPYAKEELNQDIDEYLDLIYKECIRCKTIVQNLLYFGRPKQQSYSFLSLNEVILDTLKLIQNNLIKPRQGRIRLELSNTLPYLYGDSSELKEVILNLLMNAIDATEKKGHIVIKTANYDDKWLELVITDNGIGIPNENLTKIFQPFFTTKPPGKGTGLGLSTCFRIIQKHGGDIKVFSELGKGTTFIVRLPTINLKISKNKDV